MTSRAVFYDLETTDTVPIGQILNFCFIEVDHSYKPLNVLSERVRISRLQLPRAAAILANGIDVLKHQEATSLVERDASQKIVQFLGKVLQRNGETPVPLIGFNSSRFDLLHLRTTLMRNGLNPYFGKQLLYRDVLLAARKLYISRADFPAPSVMDQGKERVSLSLENLSMAFGILGKGQVQSHESEADVKLTIELAKILEQSYGLNVRAFNAYEGEALHRAPRGAVFSLKELRYEVGASARFSTVPLTLLDANHRAALWIDLERYKTDQGQGSIRYFQPKTHPFFCEGEQLDDAALNEKARQALQKFEGVNVNNFFRKSDCDIEQDIYRLDFSDLEALFSCIWKGEHTELKDRDAKTVLTRHKMVNYSWGGSDDARMEALLKQYAMYRYAGKAKMNKAPLSELKGELIHPTFKEMMREIDDGLKSGNPQQKALLEALKTFYLKSDLYRVAGDELTTG